MLEIRRIKDTGQATMGVMLLDCDFVAYTLELPYKDNQKRVSCIPAGDYPIEKRSGEDSGKFKYDHIWIKDVPNRDYILIHVANYPKDILGCVGVGMSQQMNYVGNSRLAHETMMHRLKDYLSNPNSSIKVSYI